MSLQLPSLAPASSKSSFLNSKTPSLEEARTLAPVRNVALLGAVVGGLVAGTAVQVEAATTVFDRLNFVGANSEVARSSGGTAFGNDPFMTGSKFSLSEGLSLTNYQVVISSFEGTAFSQSSLGVVGLNIYQLNSQTNLFDKIVTLGNPILSDFSGTNQYGDDLQTLQWNISDITLNPGTYVVSPFQTQFLSSNALYLNFVDPSHNGALGLNDWSAVFSETLNEPQVSFASISDNFGSALETARFADRLTGLVVPEPSQAMLVLTGLAAILMRRWRATA